jgi:hypothetical protein
MTTKTTQIAHSLHAFMKHLIDYAGLFPPAKLPLEEAVQNYAAYQKTADRWMLSRFIIPARRLDELAPLLNNYFKDDETVDFSVLGRSGQNHEDFLAELGEDIAAITAFRQIHERKVSTEMFEVRLPDTILAAHDTSTLDDVLEQTVEILSEVENLRVFFEVPLNSEWANNINLAIAAIADLNQRHQLNHGYKLRCGGVEASVFPTPQQVAHAIAVVRHHHIAMKATAGLHHPVRHYNESVQTTMHGFLNVFGAGILAQVHQLDTQDIQAIIEDENPAHFTFTDEAFSWQHLTATVGKIESIRQQAMLSYGSCSFDEPREDLAALGLLNQPD